MTCLLCPRCTTKNSGGFFQKNWEGMCGTLPETLTLFQTKICDFPYPISDLIKNLIPYFRPEALEPGAWPERVTSCYGTYTVVGVNIKREMVLSPNDEEVANSSKNIPNSRLEGTNHTLFQTKMVEIDTLFQTKMALKKKIFWPAHTYTANIREYPPGRKTRCTLWVSLLTQARLKTELIHCWTNARNPERVRRAHLAGSGSRSERSICFILPAWGFSPVKRYIIFL